MITTKEELGREMLKALNPLVNAVEKAYEDAFDKLTVMVGVNPYHKHQEFLRRLEAIPPNLRRLVEAGMEITVVERGFEKLGRDLTSEEANLLQYGLMKVPVLADELPALRLPQPEPIKRIPKGIPWDKKRDFKRRR